MQSREAATGLAADLTGKVSEQQSNVKERTENTNHGQLCVWDQCVEVRIEGPDSMDDFGLCFDYLQGKAEH